MRWKLLPFIFAVLWTTPGIAAVALEYSVELDRSSLRKNVKAWLGEPPETTLDRAQFLSTVEERVSNSLQALGYYDADVSISVDKTLTPWQATIVVRPNEPVRIEKISIQILGPAKDTAEFEDIINSKSHAVGDVLHHGDYEALKNSILATGQKLGYFDGVMSIHTVEVDAQKHAATLNLSYNSGQRYRFGRIESDENQFDVALIDALRPFNEGDYFDLSLLQTFQGALQQTRFFSSVIVRPKMEEAADKTIPLSVRMFPAKRHNFDVGLGFSTDTEERVSLTWRSPKLNRHGHSQETRLEYSPVNPSGRISYNIPLTHPLNDILQLTARLEENEFGDTDSLQYELGVRREFRTADGWIRSYFLRALEESWNVSGVHRENRYLLPGLTFSHKSRKGLLVDPSAGFSQFYRLEGGAENLGSDIDLIRGYSKFTVVSTPAQGHRLVARAELGAVGIANGDRENLAPSLSFFAGGSQSIRGFAYQSLGNEVVITRSDSTEKTITVGGDRLLTASIEYQYYWNDTWRSALFIDGGDAFDKGEFEANYGAGFGIHYLTPVGAIKIEFANGVSEDDPEWRLHLNIGAEF
jgi:translocation and assembly module TamA